MEVNMLDINVIDIEILKFCIYQSIFIQLYKLFKLNKKSKLLVNNYLINLYKNFGVIMVCLISLYTINLTKSMHLFLSLYLTTMIVSEYKIIFKK